jgi:hypothetical protein
MKINTHTYEHPNQLSTRISGEANLPYYGVLVDLDPDKTCYWRDTEEWKSVKGLRCWIPMLGITRRDDVFEVGDLPLDTKTSTLHIYIHSGLRGFLQIPD